MAVQPQKPKMDLDRLTMLVYGDAKVGKTTLAATFPKPLFIETDPHGEQILALMETDAEYIPVKDIEEYSGALAYLSTPDFLTKGFKTVVIDTLTLGELMIQEGLLKSQTKQTEYFESQQGWGKLFTKMLRTIKWLTDMGIHVVVTCHQKEVELKNERGEVIKKEISPLLWGQIKDTITGFFDVVAYYEKMPNGTRRLWFDSTSTWWAGERWNLVKSGTRFLDDPTWPKMESLIKEAEARRNKTS